MLMWCELAETEKERYLGAVVHSSICKLSVQ